MTSVSLPCISARTAPYCPEGLYARGQMCSCRPDIQNLNGSNTDDSFTTAVSNSFLSPLEKNPIAEIWDNFW